MLKRSLPSEGARGGVTTKRLVYMALSIVSSITKNID